MLPLDASCTVRPVQGCDLACPEPRRKRAPDHISVMGEHGEQERVHESWLQYLLKHVKA